MVIWVQCLNYAKQTGLYISDTKTKVMQINFTPPTPLSLDDAEPESVDDFIYLGSIISKDNGTQKDPGGNLIKSY